MRFEVRWHVARQRGDGIAARRWPEGLIAAGLPAQRAGAITKQSGDTALSDLRIFHCAQKRCRRAGVIRADESMIKNHLEKWGKLGGASPPNA
ncbi:hypothetical protein CKA38_11545 [Ereboglobus luteus]|uniref:Uncharacterized protein n=1 Tax=Ereboglobus luteus TaxID=1796921 RepID=A0A2U8E4F4_9BACT|nr:hypothetical protein CKA38_11545 [Ereboglobus luteus]